MQLWIMRKTMLTVFARNDDCPPYWKHIPKIRIHIPITLDPLTKVLPSKTIHDQPPPPPSEIFLFCDYLCISSKLVPLTVTWADSVCLHRSLDERFRESRKMKVDKAIDILKVMVGKCPHNRHWGTLTGKSINNRKRWRSRKGRSWSCIV